MSSAEAGLVARCARLNSSTWSDALDRLGIEGVVQGLARRSGAGTMVGLAATARHICGRLGSFDRAEFAVGQLINGTGPGRVLMVDMDGANISTFGGLAAAAAKANEPIQARARAQAI